MKRETSIAARMHQAQTLLTNIQQPDLKALILMFGYDYIRLAEGQALYDNAKMLMNAQKGGYADQFQSTRTLNEQAAAAEKDFAIYLNMARIALADKQINELGITGARKNSFGGWTEQAHDFYEIALSKPGIMTIFSAYGVTSENFQAKLDTINMLRALSITQKNMIGNAQVATERKDEALKALFQWYGDLINICRIAFRSEPQHLERLGKIVYSDGYKKKPVNEVPIPVPDPIPDPEPEPEPEQPPQQELLEPVGIEVCPTPAKFKSKGGKRQ